MGCGSCGCGLERDQPVGCRNNGLCQTGGCNKLNTFNWLSDLPVPDSQQSFDIVEVTFKKGSRKDFYRNSKKLDLLTGDTVVVESATGKDIGQVSLSGELVRLQLSRKKLKENSDNIKQVIRKASDSDLEQLKRSRGKEVATMISARTIARDLNLDMKIGDVEYQGDGRKATFFYTAEDRVDFRELIKKFASEFKVKIEMRQIGARQESARIGGIGDCGRELCCSTWLTDFKSVSTNVARYQNLAINQAKLSGQCGRLKCCLNYELDTYLDAIKDFPEQADVLQTEAGDAKLLKTDIFKRKMIYMYNNGSKHYALDIEQVNSILEMNKKGKKPTELSAFIVEQEDEDIEFAEVVGQISLSSLEKTSRRRKKRKNRRRKR